MSARFTTLSLVILAVLCALNISSAATIRERSLDAGKESPHSVFQDRQAYSSEEGSDEGSEEADAEQAAQQAYVQSHQYPESSVEESSEDDDDDTDDDDDSDSRRRREVMSTAEQVVPVETATQVATPAKEDSIKNEQEAVATAVAVTPVTAVTPAATVVAPPKKTSVLILIRDTLKKVTNDLPTQQYASNALQYFQLFEHFLQETIEEVINGDDDDEDEESSTNKTELEAAIEEAVTKAPEQVQSAVAVQTAQAVQTVQTVQAVPAVETVQAVQAPVAAVPEEQKKPLETAKPIVAPQAETAAPAGVAVELIPTKITFV